MSMEITTPNGKVIGKVDCEDSAQEFVIINNKKVALQDVYQDSDLLESLNDEIKNSDTELLDAE